MKYLKIAVGIILSVTVLTLLVTATLAARQSARKTHWKNNYRQIGLALYNYNDTHNSLPPGGVFREEGTPMHGWMLAIMPYVDASPFYNSINQNQPWDDRSQLERFFNRNCHANRVYSSPLISITNKDPMVRVHMAANSWIMHRNSSVSLNAIDDKSNTMLVADSSEPYDVFGSTYNWRDPELDRNSGPQSFGNIFPGVTFVLLADGSVIEVSFTDHARWKMLRGSEKLRPRPEDVERPTEPWELGNRPHDPVKKSVPGQGT